MRTWSEANRDSVAKRRVSEGDRKAETRRRRAREAILSGQQFETIVGTITRMLVKVKAQEDQERGAHEMRRALYHIGTSMESGVMIHRKKEKKVDRGVIL